MHTHTHTHTLDMNLQSLIMDAITTVIGMADMPFFRTSNAFHWVSVFLHLLQWSYYPGGTNDCPLKESEVSYLSLHMSSQKLTQ